jgi:hypothetical protein
MIGVVDETRPPCGHAVEGWREHAAADGVAGAEANSLTIVFGESARMRYISIP